MKNSLIFCILFAVSPLVSAEKRCLVSSKTTLLYYERIQSVTIWAKDLKKAEEKFRKMFPHRTNVMRIRCREHINPYERFQ
ncbi:MAG: hypothetical protein CBC42_05665 [Betaproteobacteria bacterium TMED82]|nr:MAG: hypothetical protein CBC42_05665 [Betaproteobacteria bacterium TMED82]